MKRKVYILQTFCRKIANGKESLSCTTEFNAKCGCGCAALWLLEHLGYLWLRTRISVSYLHTKSSVSRDFINWNELYYILIIKANEMQYFSALFW